MSLNNRLALFIACAYGLAFSFKTYRLLSLME